MIYKFKSKATADVILLGPNGDQFLTLIGRAPAARGIIEPPALQAAIQALEAAVAAEDALPQESGSEDRLGRAPDGPRSISLRQRMWPMVDMLKRALAGQQPVVWGV